MTFSYVLCICLGTCGLELVDFLCFSVSTSILGQIGIFLHTLSVLVIPAVRVHGPISLSVCDIVAPCEASVPIYLPDSAYTITSSTKVSVGHAA